MAPGQFLRYATSNNPPGQTHQPQRFIRMMDVQRNPVMYPISYTPSPIGGGARFPRNTDKSRGLRHFSSRVCEKVKDKGQTNYNEVADELVTEYFDSLPYAPQNPDKQQYDAKNIRRRVYDALNVLMAMNIIEKEKKEIRWVGLPTSSVAEKRRLEDERARLQEQIRQKSDQLREYIIQLVAYKSLVNRNRELQRRKGCPPDQAVLFLPFIIVNTERKTVVECAISHDKTEYAMNFERPFEIHDDIEVLKRLGLAYGLDIGRVNDEDVEKVKQCLPPALRVYVDQIIDQPMEQDEGAIHHHDARTEIANEETVVSEDPIVVSKNEIINPNELSFRQLESASTNVPPKLLKQQNMASVAPQRRYIAVSRPTYSISPQNNDQQPAVGQTQPQYASNVAVTRPIKRTFVQQQTRPVATRYVQPSQSAVYQNATQQHRSNQLRQQLFLVQGGGNTPQPIHSNTNAGPSRYQQQVVPAEVEEQVEYEQIDVDGFPEMYDHFS